MPVSFTGLPHPWPLANPEDAPPAAAPDGEAKPPAAVPAAPGGKPETKQKPKVDVVLPKFLIEIKGMSDDCAKYGVAIKDQLIIVPAICVR